MRKRDEMGMTWDRPKFEQEEGTRQTTKFQRS